MPPAFVGSFSHDRESLRETSRPRKVSRPLGSSLLAVESAASEDESEDLKSMERRLIERAISRSHGNKAQAARLLGLTRSQLYTQLEKHRIRLP